MGFFVAFHEVPAYDNQLNRHHDSDYRLERYGEQASSLEELVEKSFNMSLEQSNDSRRERQIRYAPARLGPGASS